MNGETMTCNPRPATCDLQIRPAAAGSLFVHSSGKEYLSADLDPHYPGELCFKV